MEKKAIGKFQLVLLRAQYCLISLLTTWMIGLSVLLASCSKYQVRVVDILESSAAFQREPERLKKCADKNLMKLNKDKCEV